jgi:asparagine synthase (glutamine-hydrolysing)
MCETIRHRGPDGEGYFEQGDIHLGHRRLSVIDPAGSPQPMFSRDRNIAIVFNGEIYNFASLREELTALGHSFQTRGDTETLIYAYAQYGVDMLQKIDGMFAFAIWDEKNQSLLLARDHIGVKPLYYYWDGRTLVFGSELKALLQHPAVPREIDPEAIALYLECQYIPSPRSIYRHVRKLSPGHFLVLKDGRLHESSYWRLDYSDKLDIAESEAQELVDQELRRSVKSMLVADVPLGAFVSGGIDSSLVAALMTDILGKPVDTFSLGFSHGVQSEHVEAARVAQHIGSRHHPLVLDPHTCLETLDQWTDVFDEPFGDQAALPTYLLSKMTRQHVTVALTGEGADELFAGYGNYAKRTRQEKYTHWLGGRYSPLPAMVRHLPARMRKDRLLKAISKPEAERYATIPSVFDSMLWPGLFTPSLLSHARETISQYAARLFNECNSSEYMDRIMYVDTRLWLPDDLLVKVDRATMANSLEARVPYLDHHFVQTCARLRPDLKQHGSVTKFILKKIAERYLPHDIVHRRKQGFVMPLSEWLGGELQADVRAALSSQKLGRRNLFAPEALQRLLDQHYQGRRNHSGRLWALLVLERWFNRYAPDFVLDIGNHVRASPGVVTSARQSP